MKNLTKIEILQKRFEDANLQVKQLLKNDEIENELFEVEKRKHLIVSIPEERDFKNLIISDDKDIDFIIESQIEKYRFIKGYEAIWSQELKIVECEIEAQDSFIQPSRFILRKFNNILEKVATTKIGDEENILFEFPSPSKNINIYIGTSSLDFSILQSFQREYYSRFGRIRNRLTIKIVGKEFKTQLEATEFLIKISNSVLFQIDLALNLPLHIIMDRKILRDMKIRTLKKDIPNFQPPKYEYDKEPLALYWYARTSVNMPLLQFLAFYQVMEFYFPLYSFTEAKNRIKLFVKDPLFDFTKDTDIAHIINIIKTSAKGKSIGDEKSQIKATLQHIIDNETLTNFFTENIDRKDFFDQQKKSKSVSKQKINFNSIDNDIRIETALRIYEIRCKIVHTKEEDEAELILPYSSDIKNLKNDIELIEFLARRAIIASARPLVI